MGSQIRIQAGSGGRVRCSRCELLQIFYNFVDIFLKES